MDTGFSTLADVLDNINSLSTSDHTVYFLPSGTETMVKKTVSNSNGPVTVTIDGGGREVSLDFSSSGSLITVGSNVTLVLQNIILNGFSGSTVALVKIDTGGSLELGTGARITANTSSASSGGGVYVTYGGTFTMNGGEISDNEAGGKADGGGVYVTSGGTFTINEGKISNNEASGALGGSGGRVYFASTGTFTMNGGEISQNTAISYGGGVFFDSTGVFAMNGGVISGNTASYGGGVRFESTGTFAMYGGKISQNTAIISGGGMYLSTGAFTMNSGVISGNTASSGDGNGGGVYIYGVVYSSSVYGATFIMNNGEISRNKAFNGGGVGVDGTFTMSGGVILGNAAKGFGDGVALGGVDLTGDAVTHIGSFTMSGDARVNTDNPVGLIFAAGSNGTGAGSYLTIGGDFTGNDTVAKINLISWTDKSSSGPPAYDWPGQAVLTLDNSYYYGSLSALRNRFVLGNFVHTDAAFSVSPIPTPITGYVYSFRHKNITRQNPTGNCPAKVRGRYGGGTPVVGVGRDLGPAAGGGGPL